MGDHGGGQPNVYRDTAKKLDDKYGAAGRPRLLLRRGLFEADGGLRRVPEVAEPARRRPRDHRGHLRNALPGRRQGLGPEGRNQERRDARREGQPRNGVTGDGRASTAELGKRVFDMKIEYAVRQIQEFLAGQKPQG